ncbi:MAG: hypothetical protein K8J09_05265, partial [Planctomycetes bacterium]|nr:hypothetical protein [Planctomycetota bacterium]
MNGTKGRRWSLVGCLMVLAACATGPATTAWQDRGELQAAAEKGDAVAQFRLGLAYDDGAGVPVDAFAARRW